MLELCHVGKRYLQKKEDALDNVSFTLGPGEIAGLFGENGAGKTTLMKAILGLHRFRGTILLDGEPVTRRNVTRLSFATSEHSFFPDLTARAHREFYAMHFPTFRADRFRALMEFFQLPEGSPLRRLSTGQQNQMEAVLALSQGADYILMDEPFSGNDLFNREDFYKVLLGILEPGETVLLSTHLIEEVAPFLSRALLLSRGKLIGDVSMQELEEAGEDLTTYVKRSYRYQADRVLQALDKLSGGEEP